MLGKGFSQHTSRSQMSTFNFSSCSKCKATVIRALITATQREQIFDPQPTGGTEVDRVYSLHVCPRQEK